MYNDENINPDPFQPFSSDEDVIEMRLWAYIDGLSDEKSTIEKLLVESSAWKKKYAELMEIHQLLQASELEQPSLRFTKNVMEEISRYQVAPAAKKYINTKIVWGIAAFFIITIAGFLIYGFAQVNWSAAGSSTSPLGIDLPSVDFTKMFSNSFVNVFVMMNILLGLILLDRYLAMKRKAYLHDGTTGNR